MNLIPEPQELTVQPDKQYTLPQEATLCMPGHDSRLVKGGTALFAGLATQPAS